MCRLPNKQTLNPLNIPKIIFHPLLRAKSHPHLFAITNYRLPNKLRDLQLSGLELPDVRVSEHQEERGRSELHVQGRPSDRDLRLPDLLLRQPRQRAVPELPVPLPVLQRDQHVAVRGNGLPRRPSYRAELRLPGGLLRRRREPVLRDLPVPVPHMPQLDLLHWRLQGRPDHAEQLLPVPGEPVRGLPEHELLELPLQVRSVLADEPVAVRDAVPRQPRPDPELPVPDWLLRRQPEHELPELPLPVHRLHQQLRLPDAVQGKPNLLA